MDRNSIFDKFLGADEVDDDGNEDLDDSILKIVVVGGQSGRSVSGWAIRSPHCLHGMPYFRGYRDEWTRDICQIRLYRTQQMAEVAQRQLMDLECDDQ